MENYFTEQGFVSYPAFCFVTGTVFTACGFIINSILPETIGGFAPVALLLLLLGVALQIIGLMSTKFDSQLRFFIQAIIGLALSVLLVPIGDGTIFELLIHGALGGALLTSFILLMITLPSAYERWYLGEKAPEVRILRED